MNFDPFVRPISQKSYVVNPTDGSLVSVEDWKKTENPASATLVALVDEQTGRGLFIAKSLLEKEYTFDEAQAAAAGYSDTVGGAFRCPTRREALDIYDNRFTGLDEAIEAVGGTPIRGSWCWTCDADPNPEYYSSSAFFFYGYGGYVGNDSKSSPYSVRPVATFTIK